MQSNLFAVDLLAGQAPYDIIFCRNLLIYFDRATQHQAVTILLKRLAPEGRLFVGPAESALMMQHPLTQIKAPMAFAFRQGTPAQESAKPAALPVATAFTPQPPVSVLRPRSRLAAERIVQEKQEKIKARADAAPALLAQTSLAAVQLLADQGKLSEAASLCEQLIQRHGASAASYYLMGVIHDAADRKQAAADCYRKALYLEPAHADAMTHLAALLQVQGDFAGARLLQQRARRSTES